MSESDQQGRRRLRRRRNPDAEPEEHDHPVPKPPDPVHRPAPPPEPPRADKSERSLRGLVGSGPSQVGVSAAMRARDAARPDAEDVAAAERDLTIVRRHYEPHDPGPKPKKGKR